MSAKTYYDVLGVEKTADPQQIKRAYFGLVKQYPPERCPEEFKTLRAAYETLYDEKKRREYDESDALPETAAFLLQRAQEAAQRGRHAQAAEIYSLILQSHPNLAIILRLYARCLENQGKTGKAIEVWRQLCELEPQNAGYAFELALSYDIRGWRKKAIAEYKRLLRLDNTLVRAWLALIDCHGRAEELDEAEMVCHMAIEALKKADNEQISVYIMAFIFNAQKDMFNAQKDMVLAEDYLQGVVRVMRRGRAALEQEEAQGLLPMLLRVLASIHAEPFQSYLREIAAMMPNEDGSMDGLLAQVSRSLEIEGLKEEGFSEVFHDLLLKLSEGCGGLEDRMELISMELYILEERETCCPQLRRLKREYPQLYDLHRDFFNQVLLTRDPEKMMYKRFKALSKYGVFSDSSDAVSDESDEAPPVPETVFRTEPKVGRNEPCPCGSGKKYKKCCGSE